MQNWVCVGGEGGGGGGGLHTVINTRSTLPAIIVKGTHSAVAAIVLGGKISLWWPFRQLFLR